MVVRRARSSPFVKEAGEVGHVNGKPKAPGLYVAADHSPTRADSMRPHRSYFGYTSSISDEASVVGLQWTGGGHAHELGICDQSRPRRSEPKANLDAWTQS